MKKQVKQVEEFQKAFGAFMGEGASFPPLDRCVLRQRLLQEEVLELHEAWSNKDIVEVADAITDCMYILIGTAVEFGLQDKLEDLFDEVHGSNMSKLDENGKPIYRNDGKVMKSNLYYPPNLKSIIENK